MMFKAFWLLLCLKVAGSDNKTEFSNLISENKTTLNQTFQSLCPPNPIYFDGPCACFPQTEDQFLKDDGSYHLSEMASEFAELLFGEFSPDNDTVIRFASVQLPPGLSITRVVDGFSIRGPNFAFVHEVARRLNYSLVGFHIQDEDVMHVAIHGRIHFAVVEINPIFRMADICEGTLLKKLFGVDPAMLGLPPLAGYTRALGVFEEDYIVQGIVWKRRDPFRFLKAFEGVTWYLLWVGGALVALRLAWIPNFFLLWKRLLKSLEFTLYSVFGSPELELIDSIPGYVTVWLTMVWILQQYYGGDMLSALMEPAQMDRIDTLEQLSKTNKTILAISTEFWGERDTVSMLDNYYMGYGDIRHSLAAHTELFDYTRDFQDEKKRIAFIESLNGSDRRFETVAALPGFMARYVLNLKDGAPKKFMTVSSGHGDSQPFFFMTTPFANDVKKRAMDVAICRLNEAGIYSRWVGWATFGRRDFELPAALADYVDVAFGTICWPFFFCFAFLIVAVVVLFAERGVIIGIDVNFYLRRRKEKQNKKKKENKKATKAWKMHSNRVAVQQVPDTIHVIDI